MTLQLIKLFVLEIDWGLSRKLESHTKRRRAAEAEASRLLELETKTEVGTRLSTVTRTGTRLIGGKIKEIWFSSSSADIEGSAPETETESVA